MMPYPETLRNEAELDDFLTRPRQELLDFIRGVSSPLVVLGAGGKMGPTLAVLAKRAADAAGHPLRVIAVSRFSDAAARTWLESRGVTTLQADLLDRAAVMSLPAARDIIHLVGIKFGTSQNPALTWVVNTMVPALVCERFAGSRIVALSTGNVYPMVPVSSGGATEEHPLTPIGEYANAAVARERVFEYYSRVHENQVALIRLNYAIELRYGVLVDLARKVLRSEPIDLANPCFNCIWQGDANDMILRALGLATLPAQPWNLTSPETLKVRDLAAFLGDFFGVIPRYAGRESETALLNNSARICRALGAPPTPLETVLRWVGHWVKSGGRTLNKPTHFEVRDGRF
jgi:hypothetical protein